MNYQVAFRDECTLVPAAIALAQWEATPEHLRAGDPSGAFITWQPALKGKGWRGVPMLFRPVRQESPDAG